MTRKVLVVDDSETMRAQIGSALSKFGLGGIFAEDGAEGLNQFLTHDDIALAFVDVTMPKLDGVTMLEMAGAALAKLGRTLPPVIMVTTENTNTMVERGKKAGARGWVVKPMSHEVLAGIMAKFFS